MRDIDRFRGCLAGGAAGDALGYAVEFIREAEIFRRYGEKGITEYELRKGLALISDDTQMTLFTAAGLLYGRANHDMTVEDYAESINKNYIDWLKTQRRGYDGKQGNGYTWLYDVRDLHEPRAPGNTCLHALESGGGGSPEEPINYSKGCGGIMRVAPIGLFFDKEMLDPLEICQLGAHAAALTHGHPLGWLPSAMLVSIVHDVSQDGADLTVSVEQAIENMHKLWDGSANLVYLEGLIRRAMDLAQQDVDDLDAIHELGEGWVAEETLAIAVYCALKYPDDIDRALIASVNHKGDSDSTGAVTGNILGARLGLSHIPRKYTEKLELYDVIIEVADDLYHGSQMDHSPLQQKYSRM